MLDRLAQRLAHVALSEAPRPRRAAGSRRLVRRPRPHAAGPASDRSSRATRCSSRSRRPRGSSPVRSPAAASSSSAKKGLPSDRAMISSRQRGRHGAVGAGCEQRRQLLLLERAQLEHERRSRAPNALGKPAHPFGRCGLVGPVGREQQNRPVVEVVREEDDEIECRGVGPVQILEHEQHRSGSGALGEQCQRRLEHPQLRARSTRRRPCEGSPSGRRASTNGWNGSSVPTRSIERPTRTSNPASRARPASSDCESGLADACLSGDEDGRTAPSLRRGERAPRAARARVRVRRRRRPREPPSRPVSRRHRRRESARKQPSHERYGGPRRKIRPAARCAPAPPRPRSSRHDEHEEASDDSVTQPGQTSAGG